MARNREIDPPIVGKSNFLPSLVAGKGSISQVGTTDNPKMSTPGGEKNQSGTGTNFKFTNT